MPFSIVIDGIEDRFECGEEQNVLAAMEKLGRKGIPVGCRGGGCGICRVQVLNPDGLKPNELTKQYRTLKMSKAQVSDDDAKDGIALACKLIPQADLHLMPLGALKKCLSAPARFLQDSQRGV